MPVETHPKYEQHGYCSDRIQVQSPMRSGPLAGLTSDLQFDYPNPHAKSHFHHDNHSSQRNRSDHYGGVPALGQLDECRNYPWWDGSTERGNLQDGALRVWPRPVFKLVVRRGPISPISRFALSLACGITGVTGQIHMYWLIWTEQLS